MKQDPKSDIYSLADDMNRQLEKLQPVKWTSMQAAREYVAGRLVGRRPNDRAETQDMICAETGGDPATEYGRRYVAADGEARLFLLRLLADGTLCARGIEHIKGSAPIWRDALSLSWWRRIHDRHDGPVIYSGDGFPIHHLEWWSGVIRAFGDGRHGVEYTEPESTVTDIEVDRLALLAIIKPAEGAEGASAAVERKRPGRKPDDARNSAIRSIAQEVIRTRFNTVEEYVVEIAERYGQKDEEGIDARQVRRILFGG